MLDTHRAPQANNIRPAIEPFDAGPAGVQRPLELQFRRVQKAGLLCAYHVSTPLHHRRTGMVAIMARWNLCGPIPISRRSHKHLVMTTLIVLPPAPAVAGRAADEQPT